MYVSGRRGSLEPTIDRKRQLYRKFVDYYSRSFGFARISREALASLELLAIKCYYITNHEYSPIISLPEVGRSTSMSSSEMQVEMLCTYLSVYSLQ